MSNFGRKAAIATVAFATVGSTLFGGAALANDKDHKDGKDGKDGVKVTQTNTPTANGGPNCTASGTLALNVPVNLLGFGASQCDGGNADADAVNAIGG